MMWSRKFLGRVHYWFILNLLLPVILLVESLCLGWIHQKFYFSFFLPVISSVVILYWGWIHHKFHFSFFLPVIFSVIILSWSLVHHRFHFSLFLPVLFVDWELIPEMSTPQALFLFVPARTFVYCQLVLRINTLQASF